MNGRLCEPPGEPTVASNVTPPHPLPASPNRTVTTEPTGPELGLTDKLGATVAEAIDGVPTTTAAAIKTEHVTTPGTAPIIDRASVSPDPVHCAGLTQGTVKVTVSWATENAVDVEIENSTLGTSDKPLPPTGSKTYTIPCNETNEQIYVFANKTVDAFTIYRIVTVLELH